MKSRKMTQMASRLDLVCRILKGLSLAGGILLAIFLMLYLIIGEQVLAAPNTVSIGFLSIMFRDSFVPEFTAIKTALLVTVCTGVVLAGFFWYGFSLLRQMLAPMKAGLPFDVQMPDLCRKLGWTVVIGSLVRSVLGQLSFYLLAMACGLPDLLDSNAVEHVGFSFELELGGVLAGILIVFLGYVFAYGTQLQKESDETL